MLAGDWRVGGRAVVVTGTTAIDQEQGTLSLGTLVEVHGTSRPDGSLLANLTFSDVLASAFAIDDDYGAILVSSNVTTSVINSGTDDPESWLPDRNPSPSGNHGPTRRAPGTGLVVSPRSGA